MSLCPNPFSVMAFYLYEQLCLVHYVVINIVLACGEIYVYKSGHPLVLHLFFSCVPLRNNVFYLFLGEFLDII